MQLPRSFYLKADPDDMGRMELPLECPSPPGPRGPCTGTNFLPVEADDAAAAHKAFTNVQVRGLSRHVSWHANIDVGCLPVKLSVLL